MARFDAIGTKGRPCRLEDVEYNPVDGLFYFKNTNLVAEGSFWQDYKIIKVDGKYHFQHRLAWYLQTGYWPFIVDHKNRIKTDNRWDNLREVTRSQNAQNRKLNKNNKLGIPGIRLRKDGFYEPRLMINGDAKYLGIYKNLEEAISVRLEAQLEFHTHGPV